MLKKLTNPGFPFQIWLSALIFLKAVRQNLEQKAWVQDWTFGTIALAKVLNTNIIKVCFNDYYRPVPRVDKAMIVRHTFTLSKISLGRGLAVNPLKPSSWSAWAMSFFFCWNLSTVASWGDLGFVIGLARLQGTPKRPPFRKISGLSAFALNWNLKYTYRVTSSHVVWEWH